MITYPIWLVWPLAGLAIAITVDLGVLARRRKEATIPGILAGAAAALLPIIMAPLAAIGLWQLLIMVRPGYATLWTAAHVPNANGNPEAPFPLPYGNTPKWLGPAKPLPVSPPRIDFL